MDGQDRSNGKLCRRPQRQRMRTQELAAAPEARRIVYAAAVGYSTGACEGGVAGNGGGGAQPRFKWNTRREIGGDKRTVPGGPDPQHHH
ncbi:hypothetical protein OsJ_19192 [Oryza sativa Japonica Group]|uniref:Uncharacterized protein n=1 Tax=Oryza sativa subsp. japonica TaxID=39947 RepID=Q68Y42_ORYSJ|nr:hypothetical protein [Oryza sativa Japonica Group]EEE64352.1 hypothetical protein OsJ_19192 [Oryza sativa Japonica Group]KAF2931628.1 hypothetical protein DAI22_05g226000 [Oryza sativa Japonica Group]